MLDVEVTSVNVLAPKEWVVWFYIDMDDLEILRLYQYARQWVEPSIDTYKVRTFVLCKADDEIGAIAEFHKVLEEIRDNEENKKSKR